MMKRNSDIVRRAVHTGPAAHLVHLGLRAGATREIGITTDGGQRSRSSGEIVVGNCIRGGRHFGAMTMVRGAVSAG